MADDCPCCGQKLPDSDDLRIDDSGVVVRRAKFACLPLKELDLLRVLRDAGGRFVGRAEITDRLWPMEADVPDGEVIESHVSKLRKKVGPLGLNIVSGTRGTGAYRLVFNTIERVA